MSIQTEVIVLSNIPYKDTASIVHCYSDTLGSLTFKVSRSKSNRLGTRGLFYPFSIVGVTFEHRPTRDIQTPKECVVICNPSRLHSNPVGNAVALFSTELLHKVLYHSTPDQVFFVALKEALLQFDHYSKSELASFHLYVTLLLLQHLGIYPQCDAYTEQSVFDTSEGIFRKAKTAIEIQEYAPLSRLLYTLLSSSTPLKIPLNGEQRGALQHLLLYYLRYHYPSIGELRSPQIIASLFGHR